MIEYNSECYTCAKTSYCAVVTLPKAVGGFLCPLFTAVAEPVVEARAEMVRLYGLIPATRALLRSENEQEEVVEMSLEPPAQGTTYSQRKQQLEGGPFMEVRILGAQKYKNADGQFVLNWNETLQMGSRDQSIMKVLQFELDNGIIVPDATTSYQPQQEGVSMSSPFQPPNGAPAVPQAPAPAPGMSPPQMPMPTMPAAPSFPMAGALVMPPGIPGAPPPPATPQQAAAAGPAAPQAPVQEAAPVPGGKKKRGAAAAPPPPAPASAPMAAPPGWGQPAASAVPQMPMAGGWPGAPGATTVSAPPVPGAPSIAAPPQQQPQAAQGNDLTNLTALVMKVGEAVNAVGNAGAEQTKALQNQIAELRNLVFISLGALHHIYLSMPGFAQMLKEKNIDVGDVNKFVGYMQQFVPR